MLPPDEAAGQPVNEQAQAYVEQFKSAYIDGDPAQVKQAILEAAERYETTDIGLVTIVHDLEDRKRPTSSSRGNSA